MDEDLQRLSREELVAEVKKLRSGIREHRDSTKQDLCWHHPQLWGLLPEKIDPDIAVPAWPQFLRGCLKYRESLDAQLPRAPRTSDEYDSKPTQARLYIIARFHAREGNAAAVAAALKGQLAPVRAEAGCLSIKAYASTRDPRLFFLYSRWIDEAAFDFHATLPHTLRFLDVVQPLIDHALDVTRARLME